ncbi:plasmid stabilization protein [Altericroceibacterium spongiae]|uniref:Plasmid stabilization protein n=1 Tax=Altericroceibacterium spongiae TaxID=2320269 RepID=A0A420EAM7_9SPHN|nr:plasmid stabilization protein [Altericroceibacterium spongiae]RKF17746.1 plasmid stabilization protein [Altericroceibacterium spongiae]
MPALTVRNLPEDVHRALKALAVKNGNSTEAQVREILAAAVNPQGRLRVGEALWNLGREIGLADDEAAELEASRDRTPAAPMSFDQ